MTNGGTLLKVIAAQVVKCSILGMSQQDVLLGFLAQLEARDKLNKLLQNLFRALKAGRCSVH